MRVLSFCPDSCLERIDGCYKMKYPVEYWNEIFPWSIVVIVVIDKIIIDSHHISDIVPWTYVFDTVDEFKEFIDCWYGILGTELEPVFRLEERVRSNRFGDEVYTLSDIIKILYKVI